MSETSRTKQEIRVLKKLGISDFRQMSKDKIVQFASMMDQLDPEVAKAAIQQFPNFVDLARGCLIDYKEVLQTALDQDSDADSRVYEAYIRVQDAVSHVLDTEDLTFCQKKFCINKLKEVGDAIAAYESENKRHRLAVISAAFAAIMALAGTAATLLGGSSNAKKSDTLFHE